MLYNYLKIAFRNLWRNKVFSLINIFGFALGLGVCLLIFLYVWDELSYDHFHKNADKIYRISSFIKFGAKDQFLAVAPDPMGPTAVREIPEVKQSLRFRELGSKLFRKGDQNIKENRVIYADATLFEVFSLPMTEGDPRKALLSPSSIVLTESMAEKYFGKKEGVIGKTLLVNNRDSYKITGVIRDIPSRSHFHFDFFFSMSELDESRKGNWLSHNFSTYLLLHPKSDEKQVEKKLMGFVNKYTYPQGSKVMGVNIKDFEKSGNYVKYTLIPLTDIHLYSNLLAELGPNSNIQYVYIFTMVALLILLIACTNFMNLATAKSANRAKEVGLRKVLGSYRRGLILQFIGESVLITLIAGILAILFCELMLPLFNQLSGKELKLLELPLLGFTAIFTSCLIFVGFLAGIYPAFYLSSFEPVRILKGKMTPSRTGGKIRKGLVILQFTISTILIICTFMIYRQLDYIQNKKLGFNKDQVFLLEDTYVLGNQMQTFKQKALQIPEVQNVSVTGYLPVPSTRNDMPFFPEKEIIQEKAVSMQFWKVDEDYLSTFGMELVKGRNFSKEMATDSAAVILNEAAVKTFGFENPLGKKITTFLDINTGKTTQYKVIGIVKDFHFSSMHDRIGPLCLSLNQSNWGINFRLNAAGIAPTIKKIEGLWNEMVPGQPFNYTFLDDAFDAIYRSEQKVGKVFITFALLAILLACLGLFGLSAFTIEQRTKEIGIRKVLGASIWHILTLLSSDFVRLVLIGFLLAVPFSWYAMHTWLKDFAYRIQMEWWIFLLAGFTALLVALLTILGQALRASFRNPVDALHYE